MLDIAGNITINSNKRIEGGSVFFGRVPRPMDIVPPLGRQISFFFDPDKWYPPQGWCDYLIFKMFEMLVRERAKEKGVV